MVPSWLRRAAPPALAAALVVATAGAGFAACRAERPLPMAAVDPATCASLAAAVRRPSALPLAEYEAVLDRFLGHYCHRDPASGWVRDKDVRDTGPFTAARAGDGWRGTPHGTHAPVVIWYSPEMAGWLRANRPAAGARPAVAAPVPDGAIMVKEMFPAPASACAGIDPTRLFPTSGAAVMIRDSAASRDGWFWGWYGFGSSSGWGPDWPPGPANGLANMGFAQYCLNCHASARDNATFADARNMAGEPGEPLVFLSQDFFAVPPAGPSAHERVVEPGDDAGRLGEPLLAPDRDLLAALLADTLPLPDWESVSRMPSETFDNTWVAAGGPTPADTFLTSSQCLGCHDAGSTGLQFDMTVPDAESGLLLNLSPYGTWRRSPMGLGGRDPVFFAQLASETQTFHPAAAATVETTCLGCHGILGQRQFHIDEHARTGTCGTFPRTMIDAVPWPAGNPTAGHADYGMLARDGVSCTACHRMAVGAAAGAAVAGEPQNACIAERQAFLNPDNTGFARTFSGSFFVGAPDRLAGPFDDPKTAPMLAALGNRPVHDPGIASSELCGSCHTVHLPVLVDGAVVGHVYEQTTYAEWAFSAYRTGDSPDGPLPGGAGAKAQSCQGCHMPSREPDGSPTRSRIASIEEHSRFPEAENALGPDAIDLPIRDGFARHTLVGLNVFLLKIAQQFPDILGIGTMDPMMVSLGVAPLLATEDAMLDQAANATADIAVTDLGIAGGTLAATIRVTSHTGHKLPSGVGFRRAFLTFRVLDQNGETLWASGRTNAAGLIVDAAGAPVDGELWWTDGCGGRVRPGERPHQPHYQTIGRQDEAQIYQELVAGPPAGVAAPVCGHAAAPAGELTTSFLSICAEVKDNRILPAGYLPLADRTAIATAFGAGADLAEDAGSTAIGDDPDYRSSGGGDTIVYRVPLADLPAGAVPASVSATLSYQATPPYYLQDRFCSATGPDVERLRFLVAHLDLDGTEAESWKLDLVSTGPVPIPAP